MSGAFVDIPVDQNDNGTYDLALGRSGHDLIFKEAFRSIDSGEIFYQIFPIDGADRVAQQVKMTLLAFLGEWFLNINFGVPYLEEILIKNPRLTSVESILRAKIINVPDVKRIDFLSLDYHRQERMLIVEFHCTTNRGLIKDSVKLNLMRTQ